MQCMMWTCCLNSLFSQLVFFHFQFGCNLIFIWVVLIYICVVQCHVWVHEGWLCEKKLVHKLHYVRSFGSLKLEEFWDLLTLEQFTSCVNRHNHNVWYPLTLDVFAQFLYKVSMATPCIFTILVNECDLQWLGSVTCLLVILLQLYKDK